MSNLFFVVLDCMVSLFGYISIFKARKAMRIRLNLLINNLY